MPVRLCRHFSFGWSMGEENLRWRQIGKTEIKKTAVMTVNEITSVSPDGEEGKYIVTDAPDWVIVVAEKDENFLMVRQWRHGENNLSIEFPGGVIERGEEPVVAAARELKEETGFVAGKLVPLGKMNPNPALMSNHVHFFAASDLKSSGAQSLDDDEYVDYMEIPKKEVFLNMASPEYQHALMASALLRYAVHNKKESGGC